MDAHRTPAQPPAREGFRLAMSWLHTWAGLVLGWLLFAIFLTGTLSLFKDEFNLWMRPALHGLPASNAAVDTAIADKAQAALLHHAQGATQWFMRLPDARNPAVHVLWRGAGQRRLDTLDLHPQTGEPIATRHTMGGDFFYRFHFELRTAQQGRWTLQGRWIVGVATLLMFIALLTGIVTHRRFFKDFFTFRPGKGGQRAWLDAHNVTGVLALPFYLMITFSGLMIFHSLYMPAGIATAYRGDKGVDSAAYFADLQGEKTLERASTRPNAPAEPLSTVALQPLIDAATRHWDGGQVGRLQAKRDAQGRMVVDVIRHDSARLQYRPQRLRFDAQTGNLLEEANPTGPGIQTFGVLVGLHMARFASPGLRWALFGLGLLGCLMIATGLVLWSVKRSARRQRQQHRKGAHPAEYAANAMPWGERLVEALNQGTLAGLPLACGVYLAANRLLPLATPARADAELLCFFAAWGLSMLWALWSVARSRYRAGWYGLIGSTGVMWAGLPVLNALTTGTHLGVTLPAGEWMWAGMDLSFLTTGMLLCALAWRLRPGRAGQGKTARQTAAAHTPHQAPTTHPVRSRV